MSRAVGIDLGTTNSVVSVLEGGESTVIANAEGSRTTPSVVAFARNGEVLVGQPAKNQAVTNVDRTIRSVKRHMGEDWTVDIDDKKYTPQEISARTLMKLKRDAEAYLGEPVTNAVITVTTQLGLLAIAIPIGVFAGVVTIHRGEAGRGWTMILIALTMPALSIAIFANPAGLMYGEGGLLEFARRVGFSVAQAATPGHNGTFDGVGQLVGLQVGTLDGLRLGRRKASSKTFRGIRCRRRIFVCRKGCLNN